MKKLCFLIFVFFTQNVHSQNNSASRSNEFSISGKVKMEKVISLSDLEKYPTVSLKNVNISCSPRREDKAKLVKGVLLKNILDSVTFLHEKSKTLNQYYFLFIASDGYKVVFSFNEIYNTEVGNNLYIVTEIEKKQLAAMPNRILMITMKDIKSGSRNVKWLSKIVVCSAD